MESCALNLWPSLVDASRAEGRPLAVMLRWRWGALCRPPASKWLNLPLPPHNRPPGPLAEAVAPGARARATVLVRCSSGAASGRDDLRLPEPEVRSRLLSPAAHLVERLKQPLEIQPIHPALKTRLRQRLPVATCSIRRPRAPVAINTTIRSVRSCW